MKNINSAFVITAVTLFALLAQAQQQQPSQDASRTGAIARGMIVPSVEETSKGVRIVVDTYSQDVNDLIYLELQIVLKEPNAQGSVYPLKLADLSQPSSEKVFKNGKQLKFDFTIDQLNEALTRIAPAVTHLKIAPGTPLLVYAKWANGHQWGGSSRGGQISLPGQAKDSFVEVIRPTGLDVAVDIDGNLANRFQASRSKESLKVNGQIRSRVEGEGKFQIYQAQLTDLKAKLFEIANDTEKAKQVLGDDWKVKVEDRYMKRDSAGQLILAKDGFPIPDPMVDTYYDNATLDGAKNDMAIRYRWTEGNATGAWNFKPGIGRSSAAGVMYRLEYGVDTTSDKPAAIAKFADSLHALNPFQKIREQTGQKPSSFFKPAVKIIDHRYKFKLEHTNGLIIEISLDDATAENLREGGKRKTRFGQLEMDIDHLATSSTSKLTVANSAYMISAITQLNTQLSDKAVIAGGIALHDEADLKARGNIISGHADDFRLATEAIVKLRNKLLGKNWMPGAQKYAIAAESLRLIKQPEASKSVRALREKERTSPKTLLMKLKERDLTAYELSQIPADVKAGTCKAIFAK